MQMSDSAMVTAMVTLQLSLEQRSDEEALEGLRMKKEELQESHNKLRDDRYLVTMQEIDGLVNCGNTYVCSHALVCVLELLASLPLYIHCDCRCMSVCPRHIKYLAQLDTPCTIY